MLKETIRELKKDANRTDIKSLSLFMALFSGIMCILNIYTHSYQMAMLVV